MTENEDASARIKALREQLAVDGDGASMHDQYRQLVLSLLDAASRAAYHGESDHRRRESRRRRVLALRDTRAKQLNEQGITDEFRIQCDDIWNQLGMLA